MHASRDKNSYPWFPPELVIWFASIMCALLAGLLLPALPAAETKGDSTLLIFALALSTLGPGLLFAAKLPLYRQRRFFTFGPSALDGTHRKLYGWAYFFTATGVVLLGTLASGVGRATMPRGKAVLRRLRTALQKLAPLEGPCD